MVLRALLLRHERRTEIVPAAAPGGRVLRSNSAALLGELQQHQFTPARLRALADRLRRMRRELRDKLHDLALLLRSLCPLAGRGTNCRTPNSLLDFATDALRQNPRIPAFQHSGFPELWLDGFAEMTPQELDLLAAVLPYCDRATLAFCLETAPETGAGHSWLSIWSAVAKTYQQCRQRLEPCRIAKSALNCSNATRGKSRFAGKFRNLPELEQNGSVAKPVPPIRCRAPAIVHPLVACANPEAEAVFAAREILKFRPRRRTFSRHAPCWSAIWKIITSRWRARSAVTQFPFSLTAANPSPTTRWPN